MVGRDDRVHVTFRENVYVLLHNRLKVKLHNLYKLHNCIKVYKTFTLAVFSVDPLVRIHSKMKSRKKGEEMGDQTKVLLDSGLSWKSLGDSRIPKICYLKEV